MTPISDIVDFLIIYCPHCKTGQFVTEWGIKQCKYEKCGLVFEVPYDPELLLKEAIKIKKNYNELFTKSRTFKRKEFKIVKLPNGSWKMIPTTSNLQVYPNREWDIVPQEI